MAPLPPVVLRRVERVLSARVMRTPSAWLMHALGHTAFPVFGAERFAETMPGVPHDPSLSPFTHEFHDAASTEGPLGGGVVVVKDSIDVRGAVTACGVDPAGRAPAEHDAAIVARARAAGGRIRAKAKMTELGLDGLGAQVRSGMPHNPRAPGYFPGGSSTGTAVAVAAGLARFGIGGDGMGSIRIPAAFCGLVGLKPTHGRLPVDGYPSVAPTMDVPGPIARDATDCALLWHVLAGETPRALTPQAPKTVGVIKTLGPSLATRAVARAFAETLARLRTRVEEVDVPLAAHCAGIGMVTASHEVATGPYGTRAVNDAGRLTLALGRALPRAGYARITARRARLRDQAARALDRVDVIAMPTSAVPPPAVTPELMAGGQDGILLRAVGLYTPLANVIGFPAIAVPAGDDERGRPLSVMFLGKPGSEEQLLQIALALEP